jgi:hypothetical protein
MNCFKSNFNLLLFALFTITASPIFSQNVDEIINSYYETVGGKKWEEVKAMKMTANIEQGGMQIPVEVVTTRDGKTYTEVTFMGNTMTMNAFDGKKSWTTNFMTMQPEESTADDSENAKRAAQEFPNALFSCKKLGYKATLLGKEKIEGTECYKIKLDKKTMLVEGKEIPYIEYYYLDTENNVPIMIETEINSGEMKGKIAQTKLSDYQEVEGVFVPYSTTSGIKDGPSQAIQFEKVEINPSVDEKKFSFPKK